MPGQRQAFTLDSARDQSFTLEEFVTACNTLLADHLPNLYDGQRAREDVTVRAVRHYAGEGLIDEPLKLGREARYTHRHLIQVLVTRRLMAEGYTSKTIPQVTRRDTTELEAILRGEPTHPQTAKAEQAPVPNAGRDDALAYLKDIRSRHAPAPSPMPAAPAASAKRSEALKETSSPPLQAASWARYELASGLELFVRSDAQLPQTPNERTSLLERLESLLIDLLRR